MKPMAAGKGKRLGELGASDGTVEPGESPAR